MALCLQISTYINFNWFLSILYYIQHMNFTDEEKYIVKIERESKTGNVIGERWFNEHEQPHRIGGPAIQRFDAESGKLIEQAYYKDNRRSYREDGLHAIHIDPVTDVVIKEDWKDGGDRDPNLPSTIERDPKTGNIVWQVWTVNGAVQRDGDQPARVTRDPETGVAVIAEYWHNNNPHREVGPARIERDAQTGEITNELYFLHGDLDYQRDPNPDLWHPDYDPL